MALELIKAWPVAEYISTLIYCHHGLNDCISLETGQSLQERRLKKEIEYDSIKDKFFQICDRTMLEKYSELAMQSYRMIFDKINAFIKNCNSAGKNCGNGDFYRGMYWRVSLSHVFDGDWTDTASFFDGVPSVSYTHLTLPTTSRV